MLEKRLSLLLLNPEEAEIGTRLGGKGLRKASGSELISAFLGRWPWRARGVRGWQGSLCEEECSSEESHK